MCMHERLWELVGGRVLAAQVRAPEFEFQQVPTEFTTGHLIPLYLTTECMFDKDLRYCISM